MVRYDAGTTNPTLLNRLGDWRDHQAWFDFVTRYDPVNRFSSRRYRLDAESTDQLCQRVWIYLAGECVTTATTSGRRLADGSAGCATCGRSTGCERRRAT